jgi:hypothetical protein
LRIFGSFRLGGGLFAGLVVITSGMSDTLVHVLFESFSGAKINDSKDVFPEKSLLPVAIWLVSALFTDLSAAC